MDSIIFVFRLVFVSSREREMDNDSFSIIISQAFAFARKERTARRKALEQLAAANAKVADAESEIRQLREAWANAAGPSRPPEVRETFNKVRDQLWSSPQSNPQSSRIPSL